MFAGLTVAVFFPKSQTILMLNWMAKTSFIRSDPRDRDGLLFVVELCAGALPNRGATCTHTHKHNYYTANIDIFRWICSNMRLNYLPLPSRPEVNYIYCESPKEWLNYLLLSRPNLDRCVASKCVCKYACFFIYIYIFTVYRVFCFVLFQRVISNIVEVLSMRDRSIGTRAEELAGDWENVSVREMQESCVAHMLLPVCAYYATICIKGVLLRQHTPKTYTRAL